MNWKKTAAILTVLAAVLAAGVIILVSRIDANRFKPDIAAAVRNATGRELTLAGDLDLRLGFHPILAAEEVRLGNAPWGTRPDLAVIRRLEIQVALLPLLQEKIEVRRFVLKDADILVETSSSGALNLDFGPSASKEPPAPEAPGSQSRGAGTASLTVHDIDIQNSRFTYRDGQTGAVHAIVIEHFASASDAGDQRMTLALKGAYNDFPIEAEGTVGLLADLLDPGAAWPLDLTATVPGVRAEVRGTVMDLRNRAGIDITIAITAETNKMEAVATLAGIEKPLPDAGTVRATGRLRDASAGGLSLEDIAVSAQPAGALFSVKGAIQNIAPVSGGRLDIHLEAPSLPRLASLAEVRDLPDVGAMTLDAALEIPDPSTYRMTSFEARVSESDVSESGTLTLGGPRPKISATLSSGSMDLRFGAASPSAPDKKPDKAPPKGRVFSADPLPFDMLHMMDAEIKVRIARLLMEDAALSDVSADIRLDAGRLEVSPLKAGAGGAVISAALKIDANGKVPALSHRIQVHGLNLGSMFQSMGVRDAVSGKGDVNADLTSRGRSVAEIMGNLNGKAAFALQNGFVRQRYIDLISFDVTSGIAKQVFSLLGKPSDGKTDIRCLFVNLDINNGLVDVSPLVMNTPEMTIFGSGDINLKNEQINLSVSSEPTKRTTVIKFNLGQLARIFKITGTLADPRLGIDPVESSVVLAKMFGGRAFTGTALAVETLLGAGSEKENPCLQMVGASDAPAPDRGPAGTTADTLRKTVEDTGKSILNIFKKK